VRRGVGNLVSAGAGGWVRFWECHAEGGLVAQFNAGHRPGASITAICTDRQNFHFLVTGDTDGYVKVWFVPRYANAEVGDDQPIIPPHPDRFQLLREAMILRLLTPQRGRFAPPPAASEPNSTWSAPRLVTAFRGHLNVVTSLDFVDGRDCFVSASDDFSVRMWTVYGAFIGIFGQETPWLPIEPPSEPTAQGTSSATASADGVKADSGGADEPSDAASVPLYQPRRVPADVRRVASACTLRIMYGGHVPQWKATKAKMLAFVELHQRLMQILQQQSSTRLVDDTTERPRQLSDLPPVEHSRILGKSYRRQRRYRPVPTLPPVLQTDVKVSCDLRISLCIDIPLTFTDREISCVRVSV